LEEARRKGGRRRGERRRITYFVLVSERGGPLNHINDTARGWET
jgi:hypothetical protein